VNLVESMATRDGPKTSGSRRNLSVSAPGRPCQDEVVVFLLEPPARHVVPRGPQPVIHAALHGARGSRRNTTTSSCRGGPGGADRHNFRPGNQTFWDHLGVAIDLHKIHKVIVLDHRDCGPTRSSWAKIWQGSGERDRDAHDPVAAAREDGQSEASGTRVECS